MSTKRVVLVAAGAVVAVLATIVVGVIVRLVNETPRSPAASASALKSGELPDPADDAWTVARAQVDSLLGKDEQAWLALVDPAQPEMVPRYRTLFRTLQAMGLFHAEPVAVPSRNMPDGVTFEVGFSYCFTDNPCPAMMDQPRMVKTVRVKTDGGRLVMTTMDFNPKTLHNLKAPPWADDALVIAHGKRVLVGASASTAADLPRVVALADQAAVDLDRFGRHLRAPQGRYRIFLADRQDWGTWHGGRQPDWAIGFAWEVPGIGMDVVLNADRVLRGGDDTPLATIRHEMGHVLTLVGATPPDNPLEYLFSDKNQWLREGIAEYIGQNGRPAQQSTRRYALQRAFRSSSPPRSIAVRAVFASSERASVGTLYSMGYFAASCLAAKYGEAKLFQFGDLVLRQAQTADAASRATFGQPFASVDRSCVRWIRQRV